MTLHYGCNCTIMWWLIINCTLAVENNPDGETHRAVSNLYRFIRCVIHRIWKDNSIYEKKEMGQKSYILSFIKHIVKKKQAWVQ